MAESNEEITPIVMVIGHLISAETWRKQRDGIAQDMILQYSDKPVKSKPVKDRVSLSVCTATATTSFTRKKVIP